MTEDFKESKINNPRRLEAGDEIVTYLTQLDSQLSEQGLDETDTEVTEALVNNVLSEINTRCASLASDRRTSLIIEKLILKSNLSQIIEFCQRMSPYAIFLARNRYSSHVMQSLVSRLCFLLNSQDISDEESELMSEAVLELLNPITQEIVWLSKDISASHVMRSCICLLAGIPVIAERKGKGSKHQHSVTHSMTLEAMLTSGLFVIDGKFKFNVPHEFLGCLENVALALSQSQASVLHELLADASSSAVMSLLVRLLASPALSIPNSATIADNIFRQAMEWPATTQNHSDDNNEDDEDEHTPAAVDFTCIPANIANTKMFYAMSGDRAASHFLETVIECCSLSTVVPILYNEVINQVKEYAQDNVANFVIQSICKRISLDIDHLSSTIHTSLTTNKTANQASGKKKKESGSSANYDNHLREHIQVLTQLIAFSEALVNELCEESLFTEMMSTKGGVVLWVIVLVKSIATATGLTQMSGMTDLTGATGVTGMSGKSETEWRQSISSAIVNHWTANGTKTLSNYIQQKLTAVETKEEDDPAESSTPSAVKKTQKNNNGNGPAKREGGVDSAKLILARQIGALLQLHHIRFPDTAVTVVPAVTSVSSSATSSGVRSLEAVLSAVAGLPSDTLKLIAQSGQLSRAMLDPFIEHHSNSSQFQKFINNTFMSIAWELAGHYVGQHIFRNVFTKLVEVKDKEKLMKLLMKPSSNSSHSGNKNNNGDNAATTATTTATAHDVLNRTKEGRNSLKLVDFEGYMHNPTEWSRSWKRQSQALDLLHELDMTSAAAATAAGGGTKSSKKSLNQLATHAHGTNQQDDNDLHTLEAEAEKEEEDEVEEAGGGNKKRKRKRSHKNTIPSAGAVDAITISSSSSHNKSTAAAAVSHKAKKVIFTD